MQNLATIEKIHSFSVHENADKLELAKIMGFQVVVKKGEFKEGDTVVFVWPDTISEPRSWNSFLRDSEKPVRIKSCKLRGQFSTGLVLPIETISGNFEIGQDVSELLGVSKYEKDCPLNQECETDNFPSIHISKTDEDLAMSKMKTLAEFQGKEVYLSLKIDGQSSTVISYNGDFSVSSRNRMICEGDNVFWNTALKYGLREKMKDFNIALQYEQYGPKIQGNPLGVHSVSIAVFNIKSLNTQEYFGLDKMTEFCEKLDIPMVPVIKVFDFGDTTFEDIQNIADSLKYDNGKMAEGLVMRPTIPVFSTILGKNLSVKFINRNYKD
jgi:RNA ligase (TIGR02306 family)